ncbi:hypothetical protein ACYPKM_02895 [Pseudomonas aeruginosa]
MSIHYKTITAMVAVCAALAFSGTASAGSCSTIREKINNVFSVPANGCVNIVTQPDMTKNPYVYTNRDAGDCSLGLQMPGLPDFGLNAGGFDLCGMAKMVTGDMVNKANSAMNQKMNDSLNTINQASQSAIGTNVTGGTNVGDIVNHAYEQAGGNGVITN